MDQSVLFAENLVTRDVAHEKYHCIIMIGSGQVAGRTASYSIIHLVFWNLLWYIKAQLKIQKNLMFMIETHTLGMLCGMLVKQK